MRDIYEIYGDAVNIVEECLGYDLIGNIENVVINSRAISRWGACKRKRNHFGDITYTIEISSRILGDDIPYNSVLSVMVHEILHATRGAKGHKGLWLDRANIIMREHPELSITRCTSSDFFGLEDRRKKENKYACECDKCGIILTRAVRNKFVQNPERYIHTGCGGHFKRVFEQQTILC